MRKIIKDGGTTLVLLSTLALLGGCVPIAAIVGFVASPIGQLLVQSAEAGAAAVECNLAGTANAGSFKHTSSTALCRALGGTPVRTVAVAAGTPIATQQ